MKYGKLIILILFTVILFTGCTEEPEPIEKIEDVDLSLYTDRLSEDFSYGCTVDRFTKYITDWSDEAVVDNYGNVIFQLDAALGYEDVTPLVLVVSYNPSYFAMDINNVALCQYIVENIKNHGSLTIILTENYLNNHSGAINLSSSYFPKGAEVISIDSSYKTHTSLSTGNQVTMNLSLDTQRTDENLFNTAYKIKITDISTSVLDEHVNKQPNPIKILGELLGYFKMKSMAYQFSEIKFETIGSDYPLGAEVTILINDYTEAKFISYMDSKIGSFNDKYLETNPIVSYTYEKVELPETIYTTESSENIVSLLYTITNGTSVDSNDDVYAISTLNCIDDLEDKFSLCMLSNSRSDEALSNLLEEIETVSSFVGATLNKTESLDGFNDTDDSLLYLYLNEASDEYLGDELNTYDSVRYTNCSYLNAKNTNLDIIHMFIAPEDAPDMAGIISTYMLNKKTEEE